MSEKIIGIMGGMGPDSTVELYSRIIAHCRKLGAKSDQDHPEVIISSVPSTPDRTEAILGGGPDPEPELFRSAERLEAAGADFIAIACNTAHYYLTSIRNRISIPVLDPMELTARFISSHYKDLRRVGILATTGAVASKLFQNALSRYTLTSIVPDSGLQEQLMVAIYGSAGVKATGDTSPSSPPVRIIARVAKALIMQQVEGLIAGCTEITLGLKHVKLPVPLFDSLEILAMISAYIALDVAIPMTENQLL